MSAQRQSGVAIEGVRTALAFVGVLACAAGCVMSSTAGWHELAFGDVLTFRSPVPLQRTGATGIDTNVAVWAGDGVRVLVDHGLFADPLTGHAGASRVRAETIDGVPARVVAYERPGGGRVAAAHFMDLSGRVRGGPVRLTLMAEADTLDEETLVELVRSIRFTEPKAASFEPT
jgi:hypothetical protein